MKEIIVWGDITKEFDRLGIHPQQSWSGYGWSKNDPTSVWELTDEDFRILDNDPRPDEHWFEADCGWRYAEGSVLHDCTHRVNVNHHYMLGFKPNDIDPHYRHLLEYLCDGLGCSVSRNVVAVCMDLARHNNMTLGELFSKYQEVPHA